MVLRVAENRGDKCWTANYGHRQWRGKLTTSPRSAYFECHPGTLPHLFLSLPLKKHFETQFEPTLGTLLFDDRVSKGYRFCQLSEGRVRRINLQALAQKPRPYLKTRPEHAVGAKQSRRHLDLSQESNLCRAFRLL